MVVVDEMVKLTFDVNKGKTGEVCLYFQDYNENYFTKKEDFINHFSHLFSLYMKHINSNYNYDFVDFLKELTDGEFSHNFNIYLYKFTVIDNMIHTKLNNKNVELNSYGSFMINDCLIYVSYNGLLINKITNNKTYYYYNKKLGEIL